MAQLKADATAANATKPNKNHGNISSNENNNTTRKSHASAMVALCGCVFCFGYLVISVFPYSGYMAIALVDGANEENAGYYAGFLSSAFMVGRALTSVQWGHAADVYGRLTVMYASLGLSMIFSILFGLSTSFAWALVWRFFLGLSNGLMGTAKTVVAEIAGGDKALETRGMGIMVGMWGWSFMASPAISGAIVLVTQQYPSVFVGQEITGWYTFLEDFLFFLANALGAVLCLLCMVLVHFFIHETLPTAPRSVQHMPVDVMKSVHQSVQTHLVTPLTRALFTITEEDEDNDDDDENDNNNETKALVSSSIVSGYGTGGDVTRWSSLDDSSQLELPDSTLNAFCENDMEQAIRSSVFSNYDEQTSLLATNDLSRRLSLAHKMARVSNAQTEEKRRNSRVSWGAPAPATIASLWAQQNTRNHMIVYWVGSFVQVALDEGLPLFLLARHGGLALSAKAIGAVLSASGGVYVVLQYFTYAKLVDLFGLYGAMKVGSFSMGPFMALFPVVLLFQDKGQVLESLHVDDYGDLTWPTLFYLTMLLALYRTLFMAFFSSLLVSLNRTVIPEHRGTMNGLATLGGSVSKAMGPSFAGLLVGFSLSSGVFEPPSVGTVFMFLVLAALGGLTTVAAWTLLKDEEEEPSKSN